MNRRAFAKACGTWVAGIALGLGFKPEAKGEYLKLPGTVGNYMSVPDAFWVRTVVNHTEGESTSMTSPDGKEWSIVFSETIPKRDRQPTDMWTRVSQDEGSPNDWIVQRQLDGKGMKLVKRPNLTIHTDEEAE